MTLSANVTVVKYNWFKENTRTFVGPRYQIHLLMTLSANVTAMKYNWFKENSRTFVGPKYQIHHLMSRFLLTLQR